MGDSFGCDVVTRKKQRNSTVPVLTVCLLLCCAIIDANTQPWCKKRFARVESRGPLSTVYTVATARELWSVEIWCIGVFQSIDNFAC